MECRWCRRHGSWRKEMACGCAQSHMVAARKLAPVSLVAPHKALRGGISKVNYWQVCQLLATVPRKVAPKPSPNPPKKLSPGTTPRRAFGGGPASFWAKQRSASGQHRKRSSKGAGTRAGGVADAGAGAPDLQRLQHRALCLSLSLPLSIFLSRSLTHTHAHPHPRVYAWMAGTAPTLPSPPLSHPLSLRGMQVISPTRELALQTFNFFKTYSKFTDLTGEQVH